MQMRMKTVRFRGRAFIAVAIGLVCVVALIRTSVLSTSSSHDDPALDSLEVLQQQQRKVVVGDSLGVDDAGNGKKRIVDSDVIGGNNENDRKAFYNSNIHNKRKETKTEGDSAAGGAVKKANNFGEEDSHEAVAKNRKQLINDNVVAGVDVENQNKKRPDQNDEQQHQQKFKTVQPFVPNGGVNNRQNGVHVVGDVSNNNNAENQRQPFAANNNVGMGFDANVTSGKYPIIVNGKFIPHRRIVHMDLKGAHPQLYYFEKFFELISKLGATGVLIEYEDVFPWSGDLAITRSTLAYSDKDLRQIVAWAKQYKLELIPLVQTFGHLEWVLKHEKFAKYREVDRYAQVICLSNADAVQMVKTAVDQVMAYHSDTSEFFHMGADEAFQIGMCERCQKSMRDELSNSRDRLMLRHIANVSSYIREKYGKRVLMWHDMLNNVDPAAMKEYHIGELVEPVVWAYAENLNDYLMPDMWMRFASIFPNIWGASAYKGADGPSRFYSNIPHYLQNHISWTSQMTREYKNFREFRGLILTGWQRFDHFAILCELLPVGVPSLAVNLLTIGYGAYDRNILKEASKHLECTNVLDPESQGISAFCNFAGAKVYQYVQQFKMSQQNMRTQLLDDYQLRGWLAPFNVRHNYSSAWYLDQIVDKIHMYYNDLNTLARMLRAELAKIFFPDAVDEFLYEYVQADLDHLNDLLKAAQRIGQMHTFPARPFLIERSPHETTSPPTPSDQQQQRKP